jgi:hypothetical protein
MEDGYKFCTQSMQQSSELVLNLFAVRVNLCDDECVYYEFANLIKIISC